MLASICARRASCIDSSDTQKPITCATLSLPPARTKCAGNKIENPLETKTDVISDIFAYCPLNEHLFLAGVSKTWQAAWHNAGRPTRTSVCLAATTLSRMELVLGDPAFELVADRLGGIICLAAREGNLEGLKAAIQIHHVNPWAVETKKCLAIAFAARGGHLEMVQWMREQGSRWRAHTCRYAARGGHLPVLQWLRAQGCPWDASTCASAALGGHLELLMWAREHQCPWNAQTCRWAAEHGHLDTLKWSMEQGCPLDTSVWTAAAKGGRLDVLVQAREWGISLSNGVCRAAAQGGQLEVLLWLREHGYRWDAATCKAAAGNGHLDLLKWSREHGCPWNRTACVFAAHRRGHKEVARWANDQNEG